MKVPFTLTLPGNPLPTVPEKKDVKLYSAHVIPYASPLLYESDGFMLLKQTHLSFLTCIEHYEARLNQNTVMGVQGHEPFIYFVFVSNGILTIDQLTEKTSITLITGQFFAYYAPAGEYTVQLQPGNTSLSYFGFRTDWLRTTLSDNSAFKEILHHLFTGSEKDFGLPFGLMTAEVVRLLYKLQHVLSTDPMKQEILLLDIMEKLLKIYTTQLLNDKLRNFIIYDYKALAYSMRLKFMEAILRQEVISIEKIADQLFTTTRTLNRAFKNTFKISPQQFITQKRMERARDLILNTPYALTDIAEMVGYVNYVAFNKMFTRYYGLSPAEIRKS